MSRIFLLFIIFFGLFFSTCQNDHGNNPIGPSPTPTEGSSIFFYFGKPSHLSHLIVTAKAMVSAPDMDTISVDLTVTDTTVTGTIEDIPAGLNRKFEIFVFDADSILTYSGEAFADVASGSVQTLNITLYPINGTGTVIIIGTFSNFPPANEFALGFDGVDDYVMIPNSETLSPGAGAFTICAWIKIRELPSAIQGRAIYNDYGSNLNDLVHFTLERGTQKLRALFRDGEGNAVDLRFDQILETEKWYHVACVREQTTIIIYVDGEEKVRGTNPNLGSIDVADGHHAFIGSKINPINIHYFSGLIDETSIWKRALSGENIRSIMHHHLNGTEDGLTAYWRMDEGEGQFVNDYAGNNHGQLGSTPDVDQNDPHWVTVAFPH